jgi:hypothetical protein
MATSFSVRNDKWTTNARIRQRTGFISMKPPRLWTSKEDAEKDVGLFVWYSSIREKNDPAVPYPHGNMVLNHSPCGYGYKSQTEMRDSCS